MKITIRTFRQDTYIVDIDPGQTVYELKCYLQDLSDNELPADNIILIYGGYILNDARTIISYNVCEDKFFVVLLKKMKKESNIEINDVKLPKPKLPKVKKSKIEKKPVASKNFTNIHIDALNNPATALSIQTVYDSIFHSSTESLINISKINQSIQNIVEALGYSENEVRHAFSASFNNPDLTVEFLLNGIPTDDIVNIGLNFGEIERELSNEWPSQLDNATAGVTAATQSLTLAHNPLDILRNNPHFRKIRSELRKNSTLLENVLDRISVTHIGLFNLIRENRQHFIDMINEPIDESSDDDDDDNNINNEQNNNNPINIDNTIQVGNNRTQECIQLTLEDEQAIKRLMDLGFSDYLCAEAYFVCDKDEERAANFLLSHLETE